MSEAQKLESLKKIAEHCRVGPTFFRLDTEHLRIQPRPDDDYSHVDCAIRSVTAIKGLPKMGFVGNEYYTDGPK